MFLSSLSNSIRQKRNQLLVAGVCLFWFHFSFAVAVAQVKSDAKDLFAPENLVAWCIVPFDAKKRGPEERAAMLEKLKFSKFAYDYRAEHIPTFDAELAALQKHKIELTAWWFPGSLNPEARQILEVIARHKLRPQLWVTGGGAATKSAEERLARVKAEAARIRPIAEEAAKLGCTVGLYNHGGWFGDPENQIAIIEELKLPNVGIVYNQHHGHEHLARFPDLLKRMLPHLYVLNLNGMHTDGERRGAKIVPLGQGELDLALLKTIRDSGYRGPIGILGHTQDDAEQRLQDNLDGLRWLEQQLQGQPADEQPKPRTPVAVPRPVTETKATSSSANALPTEFDAKFAQTLSAAALQQGNVQRGWQVFRSAKFACISCHQVGEHGGLVGPALTDAGKRLKPEEIAAALLWPKHSVKPEFTAWRIIMNDGRSWQGYKRSETATEVQLFDPATQQTHSLKTAEIEEQQNVGTLMPEGLAAAMTPTQRQDVLRLLCDLGQRPTLLSELRVDTKPAEFAFDRAPLDRTDSLWEHPVNRDRVYDYYRKQALFFRTQPQRPHLLPGFPGLDGGKQGHWGNQNENVWKDGRWNEMHIGSVLSGVFHGPRGVVPKSVCVRIGEKEELAVCFNPETLQYEALWKNGWFKFSDIRHGFMDGLRPAGEMLPPPEALPQAQPFVYHGFYRVGPRVVFAYRVGNVEMLDSPWVKDGNFERLVAPAAEHPFAKSLANPPTQWPTEFKTRGQLGQAQPYAVDTIPFPTDNPWKALPFFGDHAFTTQGTAYLCTMHGEVWRVTGLDQDLQNVTWKRFATGLHQPLGMVMANDVLHVMGRDQLTRLHDTNQDGEADFYECLSHALPTSAGGHDFTCGLVQDSQGNFYTAASSRYGLVRISADGKQWASLATGFRNPDGIGMYPDGAITMPCSEGDWTPASMICLVKPAAPGASPSSTAVPHFGAGGPRNKQAPAFPFVYLPRGLDNSSGGQAMIPADPQHRWGPLAGLMIHTSFGTGTHHLLLRDEVAGQPQGAIVPLPGDFRSGAHRAKFNPHDGQLYVSGMAGWGSYTPDDGCFHRVRYTGGAVQLPKAFHVHENGVLLEFTQDVQTESLANLQNHFAQAWNYRYAPAYGSPEFSPSHPGVIGHDVLEIAGVHRISHNRVFVELPDLQPVNQLHLLLQVDQGRPQELFLTVNKLDAPFTQFPHYQPVAKTIAAHPLERDMAVLDRSIPNAWKNKQPFTASLEIAAGKNLTFSTRNLRVQAGEAVRLTFTNPDSVPHNWVLAKPGSLPRVGALTNQLVADPEAFLRQYVPKSDDILVNTDIVPAQEKFTIYFTAPKEKGRYPYLCTFPGHWMVMNGELLVE
jgi:putative heme-binding domain-containing protein